MTTQSQLLTGGSTGKGHFYESGSSYVGMKFNSGTALGVGETVSQLKCTIKAFGSPSGDVTAKLYNSGGSVKDTSTTVINANTITSSYEWYTFDFTNTVTIANGDILAVHYSGGSGSNYLNTQWHGSDVYDSTNTIFTNEPDGDVSDGDYTFYFTYGSTPPSEAVSVVPPPIAWVNV